MSDEKVLASLVQMPKERQIAGSPGPARDRSSSCKGLAEGIPAGPSASIDTAEMEMERGEEELPVNQEEITGKIRPPLDIATRPMIVALEKLDACIRVVCRPEIASVSAPETIELDSDREMGVAAAAAGGKRKRGRSPGPDYKGPTKPLAPNRIPRWKTDLDDEEWEIRFGGISAGSSGSLKKKAGKSKLIPLSGIEKGLTPAQRRAVDVKTELFDVMSSAEISAEAVRLLTQAEESRAASGNIKGDLNKLIKLGIHTAIVAVQRLAMRATESESGDLDHTRKRCVALQVERDELRIQLEELRRSLEKRTPPRRTKKKKEETPRAPSARSGIPEDDEFVSAGSRTPRSAGEPPDMRDRVLRPRIRQVISSEEDGDEDTGSATGVPRATRPAGAMRRKAKEKGDFPPLPPVLHPAPGGTAERLDPSLKSPVLGPPLGLPQRRRRELGPTRSVPPPLRATGPPIARE